MLYLINERKGQKCQSRLIYKEIKVFRQLLLVVYKGVVVVAEIIGGDGEVVSLFVQLGWCFPFRVGILNSLNSNHGNLLG